MKSVRNIAFSALLAVGAFTMVTYTACNKDECKDVVCNNGGTCVSGTCNCLSGYEGTNCQTVSAAALPGQYTASETCQPPVTGGSWSSTVSQSSNDKTKIVISNFGASSTNVTGHVNKNAITLDQTTIGGNTVTGTGTVSGNTITINYTLSGTISYSCTMIMTKQ